MHSIARHVCSCFLTALMLGNVVLAAEQTNGDQSPAETPLVEKIVNEQGSTPTDVKPKDKKEIGKETTKFIKEELKEPYLQFLASSDLATWSELQTRFKNVIAINEKFKQKYSVELNDQTPVPTIPTPAATVIPGPTTANPMPTPSPVTPAPAPMTPTSSVPPVPMLQSAVPVPPMTTQAAPGVPMPTPLPVPTSVPSAPLVIATPTPMVSPAPTLPPVVSTPTVAVQSTPIVPMPMA